MEKKEVKRSKYLKVRLTPMEKKLIEKKASHAGMQVAPYCRAASLSQKITYQLTAEELEVYQMLVKYHNHFRNIANLLKEKDSKFAREVTSTAAEIREHLKKFR